MAAAMHRRERIYEAIATGIWGTASELTPSQVEEAYRVADLVLAADPQSDDGAASAGGSPSAAVSPTAPSSLLDGGAAAPPAAPMLTPAATGDGEQGVGAPAAAESATGAVNTAAAPPSPFPRRFFLFRHVDVSEVSGTGVVAEGAEFVDGAAALRWRGANPSTAAWDSVESLLAVHGHQGATEIRWIDPEPHIGYWPVEGDPE